MLGPSRQDIRPSVSCHKCRIVPRYDRSALDLFLGIENSGHDHTIFYYHSVSPKSSPFSQTINMTPISLGLSMDQVSKKAELRWSISAYPEFVCQRLEVVVNLILPGNEDL
jgi:hypothetical protein